MDIKKVNSALNLEKTAFQTKNSAVEKKVADKVSNDDAVKTKITTRKDVVSDIELNAILENLASADSKVMNVEEADEMIRKANSAILEQRNDAVLSQANQTRDVVEKLTR